MFKSRYHTAYVFLIRILLIGTWILLSLGIMRMRRTMAYGAPGTTDFIVFWSAGQILRQGDNPHDIDQLSAIEAGQGRSEEIPLVMVNPTWMLIWLFPLFLLDFNTASLVWLAANLAIVLTSASLLWALFTGRRSRGNDGIAWLAAILFVPALLDVRMGQTTGLALLGIAGFLYFNDRKQDLAAGAFLALTTVKPHIVYLLWIVVIWWVITERRWKLLTGCTGTLVATWAALTSIRPNWIIDYQTALANLPTYWATPTIGGLLRLLLTAEDSRLQFVAPAIMGVLTIGYLVYRKPKLHWNQAISPVLLLSFTTTAYAWTYDQMILLIPYIQVVTWLREKEIPGPTDRHLVTAMLVFYLGGLLTQNLLRMNGIFQFWTPWVLAGAYAYAWSHHDRTLRADVREARAALAGRRSENLAPSSGT